ncbi:MAG: hypothetical protein A2Y07_08915 [Planctomycetes bacterium GWF2_50_10]|nr:MAG: hypothetical protein A2Y07_08915 [Planctomycetes bacterium GWF2_50_10]
MRYILIAVTIAILLGASCRKKEPQTPQNPPRNAQKEKLRKHVLIANVGKRPIKTLAMFYDDEGFVIRDILPKGAVERAMIVNGPHVEMQFFITYSDGKQSVVPKHYWSFTPNQISGIHITDDGKVLYR